MVELKLADAFDGDGDDFHGRIQRELFAGGAEGGLVDVGEGAVAHLDAEGDAGGQSFVRSGLSPRLGFVLAPDQELGLLLARRRCSGRGGGGCGRRGGAIGSGGGRVGLSRAGGSGSRRDGALRGRRDLGLAP